MSLFPASMTPSDSEAALGLKFLDVCQELYPQPLPGHQGKGEEGGVHHPPGQEETESKHTQEKCSEEENVFLQKKEPGKTC